MNSTSPSFDQTERQTQQQKKQNTSQQQQQKKDQQQQEEAAKKYQNNGVKPIWNYQNMVGRKALPNSMKDPFYSERAKFIEERKRKRQEYFNSVKIKPKQSNDASNLVSNHNHYQQQPKPVNSSSSSRRTASVDHSSTNNQSFQQKESVMKLISKNLASNPIYEEDEDLYINKNVDNSEEAGKNEGLRNKINENNSNSSSIEDLFVANRGYVPFMRTNEILDPVHAASPIPPSRETSAIKKGREKARQVNFDF
jgi:hypothetical protein